MTINQGAILCLGYILGLFATCLWGGINANPTIGQWSLVIGAIAILTSLAVVILPRHFWQLQAKFWLSVGLIALFAVVYFQLRIPRPQTGDIFNLVQTEQSLLKYPSQLSGIVTKDLPSKGDEKERFWLKVSQVQTQKNSYSTKGNLYVTIPTTQFQAEIHAGDKITLKGKLYQPKDTKVSNDFSFADYLQKNNTFLGLKAWELQITGKQFSVFSHIRQRIIASYQIFLPPDKASLLGSMVLDRRAVNLDPIIYSHWVQAGLAHTVAASGFHVSLLLGFVTWLLHRQEAKYQFIIGVFVLTFYVLLTGGQPSILRATLMGIGSLTAILLDRKTKPLSLLLLSATLLLIYQPLWIWDLGFQLSFLATFGLLTTLKPIEKYLAFLPSTITTIIAIPLAASLWTLPLLAYQFNVIATYSIPLNILLALPITIVSLGGIIAAVVGLIVPPIGGAIAYGVGFPLMGMMALVDYAITLPLSRLSIASLHWSQLMIIYGVMLLIWLTQFGKRHVKFLSLGLCLLFISFLTLKHFTTAQITVLDTKKDPIVIAQAMGKAVIFAGTSEELNNQLKYNLMPFLREAGVNTIHTLIVRQDINPELIQKTVQNEKPNQPINNTQANIDLLDQEFFVQEKLIFSANAPENIPQPLELLELKKIGQIRVKLLQEKPFLLELKLENQPFYLLGDRQPEDEPLIALDKGYLITNPKNIDLELWQTLKPQGAIAIGSPQDHFLAPNSIVHWTETEGSLKWTPREGLVPILPKPF